MSLQKLFKEKWYIEHIDACPTFTEMSGRGFTSQLYKSKIPAYSLNPCYYHDRQADYLSLIKDHKRIGSFLVRSFLKNPNDIKSLHDKWWKNFQSALKFYYRVINDDLADLSDQKFWDWAERIYQLYLKVSTPGLLDGYMFYADKRFDDLIRDFCQRRGIANYPRIYATLSAPVESSFINKEAEDLRKIVKILQHGGLTSQQNLSDFLKGQDKYLVSLIKKHLAKYAWIKGSYIGSKSYTLKNLADEIKNILRSKAKNDVKNFTAIKRSKNVLIKKYKFTPEILAISKLTEILIKWQDQRKIYSLTFVSLQEKIIREISRRTKIDLELLRYCRIQDLKKVLAGKIKAKELKARQKACLVIYQHGQTSDFLVGKQAMEFFKKISAVDLGNVKEIKGMTASAGRARGPAKIIRSISELGKIKNGDILVTSMTRPEHLSGMKKALAIVTDDGGITCHAAIISRELKKPCIIGTKIATKVLKDGDIVEVDADKGVVKILKK